MVVPADEQRPQRGRLGIVTGDEVPVMVLCTVFLVLRMIAVRSTPLVYVDSAGYRVLGLLGGERRPPTVPLFFWLMPGDEWRVVEQAVVSAVAWLVLAFVVAGGIVDRRVRLGAMAALLAVGLTTQITSWDSTILSDSLTISLTVLLAAAFIAVHRAPTRGTIAATLGITLLWALTRELHVYFAIVIALGLVVVAVRRRGAWVVLAVGVCVIAVVSLAIDRRNQDTAMQNLAGVIGGRILPDADARAWFVSEGMPALPQYGPGKSVPQADLQAIPAFEQWARSDGLRTYAKYLVTHPGEALSGPYGELLEERATYAEKPAPNAVLLSPADAYGRARPVLPAFVEDTLFAPGRTGAILLLSALSLYGALAAYVRYGADRRRTVPLVICALVLPYLFVAWLGSVEEPGRHAMPGAVAARVGVIALLAVTVDTVVTRRRA